MAEEMNDYEIEHLNILDEYLSECMVLLRKNGDFPLTEEEKKIHLYGNGVRKTIKGGTGSGEVNSRTFITIEEAFEQSGFEILTKDYLDAYDAVYDKAKNDFRKKLQRESLFNPIGGILKSMGAIMKEPEYDIPVEKEGDVAVYVLSRISGEGSDRTFEKGDVLLTETERTTILALAHGFKKFMLVLNTGGPVDLSGLEEVKNILVLSQLGVNMSKAFVEVLQGKKYPSGKLATTWTKPDDYPTVGDFGQEDDTHYKEGIYVGYRYFDTMNVDVLFPFGFGLGYTDFSYEAGPVHWKGDQMEIEATVKNIGASNGKEVLQVYLSKPATTLDEPYQILVSFGKTKELGPGEEATLPLTFKLSDFASYDTAEAAYVIEDGTYIVRVGPSSRSTRPFATITVPTRILTKKVKNVFGDSGFEDFKGEKRPTESDEVLKGLPSFSLEAKDLPETIVVDYETSPENVEEAAKVVESLTTEEKAKLVVGAFNPKGGVASVIGSAAMAVAGAAGETAQVADLKPVVMADGPAGLRLAKDYYEDEEGKAHSTEGTFPASMLESLPGLARWALKFFTPKPPKNGTLKHQYTTAIPIGTALAQSWNRDLAERCGDIVGREMERFHVHIWLAPALNIHRSILCGRNFEYFSEDPYVSGVMASAITQGVQKHPHRAVTLKHFAANNQETNRFLNSSNVSERALREIYLKGFEWCIRESNPKALMTSYNLINGQHSNEHTGLTIDLLRTEWGYSGVVMTDWIIGMAYAGKHHKYGGPTPYKVIQASGDIFMPGSKEDYENIVKAVEDQSLSMEALNVSAARIYRLAKEVENHENEN